MGLTTTLAVELWDTGINVNCLLPSATTQLFPDARPRMVGGVPASESLDPDDVAPTAVYHAQHGGNSAEVHSASCSSESPRRSQSVHSRGRAVESDAMPPQASSNRPVSSPS